MELCENTNTCLAWTYGWTNDDGDSETGHCDMFNTDDDTFLNFSYSVNGYWGETCRVTTATVQDQDCIGSWSSCTAACETATQRGFNCLQDKAGNGADCPVRTDCHDGEDRCNCLEHGIDYAGNDIILGYSAETIQACQDYCKTVSGARFFSWLQDKGCFCKGADGLSGWAVSHLNVVSGSLTAVTCPCLDNTHKCHHRATCTNVPETQGHFCECNEGYEGDGVATCEDVLDCYEGLCQNDGECQELTPGFRCVCSNGWEGEVCDEDVNECVSGDVCPVNASCKNTIGHYKCSCNPGFMANGAFCIDIDECSLNTHSCDTTNSECVNTEGSFDCRCNPGYIREGLLCKKKHIYRRMCNWNCRLS
eukprot:UN22853